MVPADDGASPAPIDRPVLELLAVLSDAFYPVAVERAVLSIRWYTNDDFKIQYREVRDADWQCRWDRHPNPHNTREHFHPPPTAETPGEDAAWPDDYREVLRLVLDEIERRIDDIWD